jgi:EAL domain-containing protein (putative c-di-GMP-specific phosphodiesterase class I)
MPSFKTVTAAATQSGKNSVPNSAQELRAQAARTNAAEHRRITARLRQALEQDDFTLLYQLQTSLQSASPRGAEALICLRHRRRGLILPSHFMPVAELSDIAIEIGNWQIMQACRDAAAWGEDFFVTVPISHRQLLIGQLVKHVIQGLAAFDVKARQMEFALTEAMLIDENDDVTFALRALRGLGAGLVLDNFGTSYASLSLLKRLPLTMLKLDRSMIAGLPGARENMAILRAAIETAHALGLGVIADGVETESQRSLLSELGCDFAQGPHFNPPVSFAALTERLSQG